MLSFPMSFALAGLLFSKWLINVDYLVLIETEHASFSAGVKYLPLGVNGFRVLLIQLRVRPLPRTARLVRPLDVENTPRVPLKKIYDSAATSDIKKKNRHSDKFTFPLPIILGGSVTANLENGVVHAIYYVQDTGWKFKECETKYVDEKEEMSQEYMRPPIDQSMTPPTFENNTGRHHHPLD
ncbi:hypothetical protein TcasGA2_TC011907 [Tribolium castaneum]|uniref:Uncharacterized protein n=1 Tax=Tribolium castaneum TaxID=7070 RepID=D6X3D3_TRICA|nr:hypothetical protein TcasGA2_TC011907 [Tribolium castaneum]